MKYLTVTLHTIILITCLLATVVSPAFATQEKAPQEPETTLMLSVDTTHVIREKANNFLGINLNYLRDLDTNRTHPRPLTSALKEMGVRWLRYPGGEKSDYCLWSLPPYTSPNPQSLEWYKTVPGTRMDFDQFIAVCRATGAEPYVVVGYDRESDTKRTEAEWLENAVALVRYANIQKKYGVKYWEIGNENWMTLKPEEMARIVPEFSRAMKAVDPTIRIGASGNREGWWEKFLPVAAPYMDFLSLSAYNVWGWKGYDRYIQPPTPDLLGDAGIALSAIDRFAPVADRARLEVIAAEVNSKDYAPGGWTDENSLGHSLVTFDILGQMIIQPRMRCAMVWTTRWTNDAEASDSLFYALDVHNNLLPTGMALALWGRFLEANMISVSGNAPQISTYASCSKDQSRLTVWIINRSRSETQTIPIHIDSPITYARSAHIHQYSGTSQEDRKPTLNKQKDSIVNGNTLSGISCPPLSITIIQLEATKRK